MEKYPKIIKDEQLKSFANHVEQNTLGNIRVTDTEPTLDTLKANEIVKYGNNLYIKFNNSTGIKITGSALS